MHSNIRLELAIGVMRHNDELGLMFSLARHGSQPGRAFGVMYIIFVMGNTPPPSSPEGCSAQVENQRRGGRFWP